MTKLGVKVLIAGLIYGASGSATGYFLAFHNTVPWAISLGLLWVSGFYFGTLVPKIQES